jgi:SAM-dependent methyltransferase
MLVCTNCGREYGFKNSVPVMLDEKSKNNIEKEWQKMEEGSIKSPLSSKLTRRLLAPLPYFWHEQDKKIESIIQKLGSHATYLNVGSKASRLIEGIINLDIDTFQNVTVVGDAHALPFINDSIDCVFIMQVIEHLQNPFLAIKEIFRVLKNGGYVFAQVPFLEGYHTYPSDYQRFSRTGVEVLFSEFEEVEQCVAAGPGSTLSWVIREFIAVLFPFSNNRYVYSIIREITGWLTFPFKYLDIIMSRKKYASKIANSFFYLGKKIRETVDK